MMWLWECVAKRVRPCGGCVDWGVVLAKKDEEVCCGGDDGLGEWSVSLAATIFLDEQ
jgi:hypothetical protein